MINTDYDINRINSTRTSEVRQMTSHLIFATDPNFQNQTTTFKPGQSVYVKVSTDLGNAQKKVLNLRDNNYGMISTHSFSSSGNNLVSSFIAPSNSGVYSVEADISANGSVVNLVKTIQIEGEQTQSSSVSISTNVQSKQDSSFFPSPSANVSGNRNEMVAELNTFEDPEGKKDLAKSLWENLFNIFRKIFSGMGK